MKAHLLTGKARAAPRAPGEPLARARRERRAAGAGAAWRPPSLARLSRQRCPAVAEECFFHGGVAEFAAVVRRRCISTCLRRGTRPSTSTASTRAGTSTSTCALARPCSLSTARCSRSGRDCRCLAAARTQRDRTVCRSSPLAGLGAMARAGARRSTRSGGRG